MGCSTYNKNGHMLTKEPVYSSSLTDSHDVVGYMSVSGRIVKYKKSTGELVIYVAKKDDQATISYYLTLGAEDGHKRYLSLLSRDYLRELMPEDDMYNVEL